MTEQERRMEQFIDRHVQTMAPLRAAANLNMYTAEVTGGREDFEKLNMTALKVLKKTVVFCR